MLLLVSRDTDGLPMLPMQTIQERGQSYKVPDPEGRIKLYSWVTALDGVAEADLAEVCHLAQRLQAEGNERYFRAGLLRLAALRWQQQQAAQQADALAAQQRAEDDAYRARQAEVEAYLDTLNPAQYQMLAASAEAELKQLVSAEKRMLWLPEVWQTSVRQRVLRRLLDQGWPASGSEKLCA